MCDDANNKIIMLESKDNNSTIVENYMRLLVSAMSLTACISFRAIDKYSI